MGQLYEAEVENEDEHLEDLAGEIPAKEAPRTIQNLLCVPLLVLLERYTTRLTCHNAVFPEIKLSALKSLGYLRDMVALAEGVAAWVWDRGGEGGE